MVAIETITSCLPFHKQVDKCTCTSSLSNNKGLRVATKGDQNPL